MGFIGKDKLVLHHGECPGFFTGSSTVELVRPEAARIEETAVYGQLHARSSQYPDVLVPVCKHFPGRLIKVIFYAVILDKRSVLMHGLLGITDQGRENKEDKDKSIHNNNYRVRLSGFN